MCDVSIFHNFNSFKKRLTDFLSRDEKLKIYKITKNVGIMAGVICYNSVVFDKLHNLLQTDDNRYKLQILFRETWEHIEVYPVLFGYQVKVYNVNNIRSEVFINYNN